MSTICVAGSTGLIGSEVAQQLTEDVVTEAYLLSRRKFEPTQPHHKVSIIDFTDIALPAPTGNSDAIICALGTTIKTAGSQSAFEAVDLHMVVNLAQAAHNAGYRRFAVISSMGANADSASFYLKTKGKMEKAVSEIAFESVTIIRPSLLLGERKEFRLGEKAAELLSTVMNPLFIGKLKKYQPVHARDVARTLIKSVTQAQTGIHIIESEQIARL